MDNAFERIIHWLAPICVFTTEEAWLARRGLRETDRDGGSVHLQDYIETPSEWRDDALAARWAKIRDVRRVVTGALEVERREKRIGASLEAAPIVHIGDSDLLGAYHDLDAAELFITSGAVLTGDGAPANAFRLEGESIDVAVVPEKSDGEKCRRCWRVLPDVGASTSYVDLCGRCVDVVKVADGK